MREVTVGAPRSDPYESGTALRFPLDICGESATLSIVLPAEIALPPEHATPAIPPALLVAMRRGAPLVVDGPAPEGIAEPLDVVQDIFHAWDRGLAKVPITWSEPVDPGAAPKATAAFFSGGADSFTTVLEHRQELDAVIHVRGFEEFRFPHLAPLAEERARLAAEELGIPFVLVTTDVRLVTDPVIEWYLGHGAGMASVAHALAGSFGRVLFASFNSYAELEPAGTHALLDPLWSSERLTIEHDGAAITRAERLSRIAGNPTVRRYLRVCYQHIVPKVNCGRCPKCVNTMLGLEIAGTLRGSTAFPSDRMDLERVAFMATQQYPVRRDVIRELLQQAKARGADPALILALQVCAVRQTLGYPIRRWLFRRPAALGAVRRVKHALVGGARR